MKIELLVLLLFTNVAFSQVSDRITSQAWSAQWIEVPDQPYHDYGVYYFRKKFALKDVPSSFIVYVSADNRYKLFVNGVLVSLGPARGDLFHWNFETVDLAQYLIEGENIISAIVWNFGSTRPEAQISWRSAFILQGNSSGEEIVNTNKTWTCIRDNAYEPLEPQLLYTYYVSGPGEKVDYRTRIHGWMESGFNDASWKNASEISPGLPKGVFGWTNGWMLVPRKIPPMELMPLRLKSVRQATGINVPESFPAMPTRLDIQANSKVTLLLDQGSLTNAYPVVVFSKGFGATITLSYAEALYIKEAGTDWRAQKQKGNRNEVDGKRFVGVSDQIIAGSGFNQKYTPLWWRTYRYIQLEIETKDEPLILEDISGIFTGYPFQRNATFDAGLEEVDNILDVGWRTARLCAAETYMDCPYYEQLQYIGDTRIQALVSLFNSGDDRLIRNALDLMDHSRMPEGITLSRYPSANAQQIPTFSLWYIEMLHDYWMYRPDAGFVKKKLQSVRSVLDFFQHYQKEDGLLKNAPYWEFTDWVEDEGWKNGVAPVGKDGSSAATDLLLCLAYRTASVLEENLGMKAYAAMYKEKHEQLKRSIVKRYWNESVKLFSDTKEKQFYSQHANSLAILADVITGNDANLLMEKILSDQKLSQATIYFKYYVHRALSKCNYGDRYLDLLGDWRAQLKNGLTTWAEISDNNNARSDCHAWGASPNIEFFRIVLGVDSDAPGFAKVLIEPHLGKLPEVSGSVPHPGGKIEVKFKTDKQSLHGVIVLPPGLTGRLRWNGKEYSLVSGENKIEAF